MEIAKLIDPCMPRLLLTIFLVPLASLALAETVYVNDSLRVGVRTEPNNSVAPHGVVLTGMQLEVLERSDGYVKIRNQAGVEGWIKDIYVTTEKPAKLELARISEERATLQAQLAKQRESLKTTTVNINALSAELETLKSRNSELRTQLAQANSGKYTQATLRYGGWVILVLVVAAGGFTSGVIWYRRQAMRRLGGLRV